MNATQFTDGDSSAISISDIRVAWESILKSPAFDKSPRMRRLLNFLLNKRVSGDVRGVSEYAIGMEVFDRKPEDYSTSEDPIARVQMGRLRGRLRAYYASLATPADLEISIPLGSYMPVIRRQGRTEVAAAYANKLRVDDIKCIAQCADGVHFTQGLQEELVHQLFRVLGAGVTLQAPSLGTASLCAPPPTGGAIAHRLEGSVRIDEERIRTSVRLVEVSKGHVAWSSQFDRNIFFAIAHQEELALSICSELKRFLLPAIA